MKTAQSGEHQSTDEESRITTGSIMSQEVFSRTGTRVGSVKDVVVDFDSQRIKGLLITNINSNLFAQDSVPSEFVLPYSWVQDADSIVLTVPIKNERVDFI